MLPRAGGITRQSDGWLVPARRNSSSNQDVVRKRHYLAAGSSACALHIRTLTSSSWCRAESKATHRHVIGGDREW